MRLPTCDRFFTTVNEQAVGPGRSIREHEVHPPRERAVVKNNLVQAPFLVLFALLDPPESDLARFRRPGCRFRGIAELVEGERTLIEGDRTCAICVAGQLSPYFQGRDGALERVSQNDQGSGEAVRPKMEDFSAALGKAQVIGTLVGTAERAQ